MDRKSSAPGVRFSQEQERQRAAANNESYCSMTNVCMVMAILLFFYSMKVTTAFTVVSFAAPHKQTQSLLSMVASSAVGESPNMPVLSPHTFEGLVERGIIDRFGSSKCKRTCCGELDISLTLQMIE